MKMQNIKPSKSILLNLLAFMVMVGLGSACTSSQQSSVESKEPLRVEYTLWWGDYTLLVAEEKGLFEKYGVNVEPVFYESYADSYSDLAAGILDGGLFAIDNAINTNDKSPIRAVAVYDDGGVYYIVGDTNVKNIADLRGKRIGLEIGSSGELIMKEALEKAGLTLDGVTLIDVAVEAIPDNLGNTIDAGLVWEPYASEALANGGNMLAEFSGTRTISPDLIVFNQAAFESRPDDIRAFLKAWFEAVDFRLENTTEANQIISAKTGIPVDQITEDSHIYTLQENIVLFSDESPENMINFKTAFNANADFLLGLGVLRNQPVMNQFVDSTYLFE